MPVLLLLFQGRVILSHSIWHLEWQRTVFVPLCVILNHRHRRSELRCANRSHDVLVSVPLGRLAIPAEVQLALSARVADADYRHRLAVGTLDAIVDPCGVDEVKELRQNVAGDALLASAHLAIAALTTAHRTDDICRVPGVFVGLILSHDF